jgi:hypothetical protein
MKMLTKTKIALAVAVVLGSGSVALAALDGDANPVPGSAVRQQVPASISGAFASTRVPATVRRIRTIGSYERDGDGNRIPGLN